MQETTLAAAIFQAHQAQSHCNWQWKARWADVLARLVGGLPSGSGFDGTQLVGVSSRPERIELATAFHHRNDFGFCTRWTEHKIRVTPSFTGLTLAISGENYRDIKEHIHEVFYACLSERRRWLSEAVSAAD